MTDVCTPEQVYRFWFEECSREQWFSGAAELDLEIRERFRDTHLALAAGVTDLWRATAESQLSAIVVLDQFPRNIYRGTPLAFATDGLALVEAKQALGVAADQRVSEQCRLFFYLPFEHAEHMGDQDRSVALFTALGDQEYLDYAVRHREVIDAYGRFPHRNAIMGRQSTEAERTYLAKPGAGF